MLYLATYRKSDGTTRSMYLVAENPCDVVTRVTELIADVERVIVSPVSRVNKEKGVLVAPRTWRG